MSPVSPCSVPQALKERVMSSVSPACMHPVAHAPSSWHHAYRCDHEFQHPTVTWAQTHGHGIVVGPRCRNISSKPCPGAGGVVDSVAVPQDHHVADRRPGVAGTGCAVTGSHDIGLHGLDTRLAPDSAIAGVLDCIRTLHITGLAGSFTRQTAIGDPGKRSCARP